MSSINITKVRIMPAHKRCLNRGFASGSMRRNRGFTILEAVIAFLVLAVGMLGIASLQGMSLQAGKTSVYASVAMMKAEELLESIRINSTVADIYDGEAIGIDKSCSTVDCKPAALAQDDLFWWSKNLTAGLPTADTKAVIAVTPLEAGSKIVTVTVTISWKERNKDKVGNSSVDRSFKTTSSICTAIPC